MATPTVAIVGQTATGKSAIAIELARILGGEIINADASQLYRGMDIGTAKTPPAQRRGVVHHQLDVLHVNQPASVAAYQRAARADLETIMRRGRVPIVTGGSGLYVKALLDPLEFPGTDATMRADLTARAHDVGPEALHDELAVIDPVAAASIPAGNTRRVIRALEVIALTGRPFSATLPVAEHVRPTVQIGIRRAPGHLDRAIELRVHGMMRGGLLEEVRELQSQGLRDSPTASRAVGYRQLLAHLDGTLALDEAVTHTISATRALARRQLKWFRRDARIRWVHADDGEPAPELAAAQLARLVRDVPHG